MSSYWGRRRIKERKFMAQTIQDDNDFWLKEVEYYDQALRDIENEIAGEYQRLAERNKETKALTKERVSKMDVQEYSKEAEKIVNEAQAKMKAGKHVSLKDYSDEVNKRLRIYNATMRINRLELLKSEVGLHLTSIGVKSDADIRQRLQGNYLKEVRRQAGILGETVPKSLTNNQTILKTIYGTMKNDDVTFSERIWSNLDALKANMDTIISSGLLRGNSYSKMASKLKQAMNSAKYAAERIIRTESSRVLFKAQFNSLKKYGYEYVQYMAEPKACAECARLARKDNGYDELGVYKIDKVPRIPDDTHPNCRCTISAFWIDEKPKKDIKEENNLLKDLPTGKYKELDDLKKVDLNNLLDQGIKKCINEDWQMYLAQKSSFLRPLSEAKFDKIFSQMKNQFSILNKMLTNKGNDVQIYISSANLKKALKDGFKNQLQTNDSYGFLNADVRKNVEWKIFSDETLQSFDDYQTRKPEDFAIYGRLGRKESYYPKTARNYGEIAVHLKDSIKSRTTYTAGDSLANGIGFIDKVKTWKAARLGEISPSVIAPVAGSGRSMWSMYEMFDLDEINFMSKYKNIDDITEKVGGMRYFEAQIHGGVTYKDIDFVEIPAKTRAKGLIAELEKRNIKYKIKE